MADGPSTTSSAVPGLGQRIKGWMDTLLVIDVFVVIAGAIWFGIAVLCHSRHIEAPLNLFQSCLLYTSPSPRDRQKSRMPSSA